MNRLVLLPLYVLAACAVAACGTTGSADVTQAPDLAAYPEMTAENHRPAIDFAGVQADLAGEPTRVLVLGTRHLSSIPEEDFSPDHLALLMERLEAFAPDVVAIEAVGGQTGDLLRRYDAIYDGAAERYCWDPAPVLGHLGLSQPEAAAAVEAALAEWPADPEARERRRLAGLFYGAGEPWSAALQWSYLDEAERIQDAHVNEFLRNWLNKAQKSRNENNLIGVALARKLGLQRLAAIDDHTADIVQSRAPETLGPALRRAWSADRPGMPDLWSELGSYLGSPEQVLTGFLFQNSERYQRLIIAKDFGAAASSPDEDNVARQYLASWQVRGLRMAANIVEAAANQPGARMVVLVGASHKAYLDAYLDMLHDVELVSVDEVLRER